MCIDLLANYINYRDNKLQCKFSKSKGKKYYGWKYLENAVYPITLFEFIIHISTLRTL